MNLWLMSVEGTLLVSKFLLPTASASLRGQLHGVEYQLQFRSNMYDL
jgi:hypothetical protein